MNNETEEPTIEPSFPSALSDKGLNPSAKGKPSLGLRPVVSAGETRHENVIVTARRRVGEIHCGRNPQREQSDIVLCYETPYVSNDGAHVELRGASFPEHREGALIINEENQGSPCEKASQASERYPEGAELEHVDLRLATLQRMLDEVRAAVS